MQNENINNELEVSNEQNKTLANAFRFAFDTPVTEVTVDVSTDPAKEKLLSAKMNRASKEDLITREGKTVTEIVEASNTEDSIKFAMNNANAWLFDRVVSEIRGIKLRSEPVESVREYREPSEELLKEIPKSWKSALLMGQYEKVTAKFAEDEEEGISLGGSTLPVDLIIGDIENPMHVIRFEIPEPTTTEVDEFTESATQLRQPKTGKKNRSRIVSNLDVAIKFFEELMSRNGASITEHKNGVDISPTVQGKTFAEMSGTPINKMIFLESIDNIYKKNIIGAAMSRYNAKQRD